MASKTTAAQQRSKSKHGRTHKPDLGKLYRQRQPPLDLASQEFRATLLRNDVPVRSINVDGILETLEWRWEEGNPTLLGTVQFRQPVYGGKVIVHDGHVLRLDVKWGGRWREVWQMRLRDGSDGLDDIVTFELADDGEILQESKDSWHFSKSAKKGKPKGWLCHEILREVARRYRIPLGKIAEGKHYITELSGEMSPMQVIQKAYAIERRNTGRRFVMRWSNSKLNVVPLRRNPLLYTLGHLIEAASIARAARDDAYATSVTVRAATRKKGGRRREKIVVTYTNEKAVAKDGFTHTIIGGDDVHDRAAALAKAKRYIAKHSVRKRVISGIQHRGIAFIRRGDGIRVSLPEHGFKGKQGIVFVSSGTWRLSGGDFTMSLNVVVDDPYKLPKERRKTKDKATRAKKRSKKK